MLKKLTVFIDFDGVLHPLGACTVLPGEGGIHCVNPFRWWPALRDALKPLDNQVELVVHSTWRLLFETDAELFAMLPEQMRAMTVGCTPRTHYGRAASIEAYVAQHRLEHFVVVDDEPNAFAPGYAPLIACDPKIGLADEDTQAQLYLKVRDGLRLLGQSVLG